MKDFFKKNARFFLGCILLSTAIHFYLTYQRDRAKNKEDLARLAEIKSLNAHVIKSSQSMETNNFRYLGHTITLKEALQTGSIYPEIDLELSLNSTHPYLLLDISELSCDVCRDQLTNFNNFISKELDRSFAWAVVFANNKRFVRSYVRQNQVEFPVLHVTDHQFFKTNNIKHAPVLFLMNAQNRVVHAHTPTPGMPQLSLPFYKYCLDFFGLLDKKLPEDKPFDMLSNYLKGTTDIGHGDQKPIETPTR